MISALNSVLNKLFEILFFPFQNLNPWFGMLFISLLTGIFMLLIFKLTSDQQGIQETKNKIKAHLLELRLYKDDIRTSFKAQGNILLSNLRYMKHSIKPLLVMIIPVILILIQSNFWFGYESLEKEQKALLKVKLSEEYVPQEFDVQISSPDSITVETPALRINEEHEIDWRFSATQKGVHEIKIHAGSHSVSKPVSVDQKPLSQISPVKKRKSFFNQILYPAEKPISKESPIKSVEITYPSSGLPLLGINIHWLIAFFGLSILFGFSLKGLFKVEI